MAYNDDRRAGEVLSTPLPGEEVVITGINYHHAEALNPACRILLEKTMEAIMDAGLHPSDLKGTNTGVYLGFFHVEFENPWLCYELTSPNFGMTGCVRSTLPQIIGHYFGLEGPAVCIDSASSSSGYALEHAFRAIRSGKCDNAIVGSANLILTYNVLSTACRLGIVDPQALNNIFNENAGGYVRSEAVCVVFLQKLKNSKRIYAQIVHSKTNADGYKDDGLMHPSDESQGELFREIYQEAVVNPSEIKYVETHSTGSTKAGDPVEINAIDKVFCQNRSLPLTIGSVKSNMGHSEPVSGLCSLVKVRSIESCWDVRGWYEKSIHIQSIVVQIALVEFLGFLELPIDFVRSSSTGVIAGAYAEKLVTLEQALSIACQYMEFSVNIVTLYEKGFNPTLFKLYPSNDLPVKASTISPLLEWDHENDWFVAKSICHADSGTEDWQFLLGHVIDGRNLLPAAAFLYIALETFLKRKRLLISETEVVFEIIKLHRSLILSKDSKIDLTIQIFKQSGRFEVAQQRLDQFRGLLQIDTKATQALVKWDDNWITFIDHMISINFLRKNCRDLALPTSVDRLVIDAKKHLGTSEMVYSGPHCNIIKLDVHMSSGVEVRGLGNTPVYKRAPLNMPLLDDYKFVPYTGTMSEHNSVRACLRVVADNVRDSTVQVVELVKDKNNVLSPTISNLFSEYLTLHEIVVFSSLKLDMPNIVVEHKEIDGIERKTSLVVVTDVSEKVDVLNQIPDRLQEGAFILVRQPPNYPIDLIKQVDVILTHVNETGVVFLLRKSVAYVKPQVVSVTDDLNWISMLQASLSDNKPIVLLSEGNDGVLGLINCLKLEYTKSSILCMFLMDGKYKLDLDDNFFRKQLKKSLLMNVLRNGEWGTYVYFRKTVKNVDVCDYVVGTTEQGNMRSFSWCQGPPIRDRFMRPEQSLTCVSSSLDGTKGKKCLNHFFTTFNFSGERVMGILKEAALGSLIASDNDLSWKIPDKWSLEEGATVPATYCTVLFALIIVGKLKDRQSILIHSAAGGVGQAALNIATYYNCTIFTTVGSMRKRNIIKRLYPSLQDSHIGISRDQSFEQMIMKQTKGKGVDIVVNSLSEQNLYAGLRCLSRGGKFFEIGRYDIMKDSNLDVRCILDNRSFFGINLDGAHDAVTWRKRQLQSALYDGIRLGYVKPLPRDVYKSDEVEAALSYMATGNHTGKIVVKIRDPQMNIFEPLTLSTKPKFYCISDKVYVLVGGLGGFGLELTDWLVKRGARKLVLVSRSGVSTDYQNFKIESWKEDGAKIVVSQQNLQTVEGCHKLIEDAHTLGSIDGIFNLAAVLDDGLFQNQNKERFASVLIPKLLITRNLDVTSRTHCPHLRYVSCMKATLSSLFYRRFVVFSSMVSGKGNIGQSSYAMGNSAMERICEIRKNEGYPAFAIQWGMIGDVGMFEDYSNNLNTLETLRGAIKQKIASCLQVLDVFLNSDETIVSSTVMVNTSNNNKSEKVDLLEEIAKFMGLNLKHISLHSPLSQMGLDSITSVEIKQFLEQKFQILKSIREVRNTTLHQRAGEVLSSPLPGEEVVITGIAGQFPQSSNVDHFFTNIMDKKDLLSKVPKEWNVLCQGLPPRIGIIDKTSKFDSGFFGINYHHAEALNPACRILLEKTMEAIMDAGLHPSDLKGTITGVYLGLFHVEFENPWLCYELSSPNFGMTGCVRSTLPQIIGHYFGLEGPAVCIDSACSSSGYALEHAFRAIRSGKCDNAIVGSANLILTYNILSMACRVGIVDPQALNKIFNENAGGYVRSEAVCVVLLQKLKNSKRIYAQILHSKTNADGYKDDGLLHPSGESQGELFREIYQEAVVNPSEIKYVETHSTGTKAGDPVEIDAIDKVFCQDRSLPLTVGSVKSNMGHSEAVSGLCSLVKIVMGLEINWMPPNINCANVRGDVPGFREGRITVATDVFDINNSKIIGANNSGFGGTNSHVIFQKVKECIEPLLPEMNLVCVSGRTEEGLAQLLESVVSKCHDKGYIALLQNIFRKDIDMFYYRGFAIVSNDKVVHKSCGKRPHLQPRLGLSFGGAIEGCTERFVGIPTFSQMLRRIEGYWDLRGFLELPIDFVRSSSTGVIAGAYAEKLVTLEQALSIACQYMEFSNGTENGEPTFHSLPENKRQTLLKCLLRLDNRHTNLAIATLMLGNRTNTVMVTDTQSLLTSLGWLYEKGFNPTLFKLYPSNDLPVKASTISPLLKWDHENDWFVAKSICHADSGTEVVAISLDGSDEDWQFLLGHVIDGRNLLPGTAFLYIALETFLKRKRLLMSEIEVVFERIKLHRSLILSKDSKIDLTIQIFKQSGRFEITHHDELLVSGRLTLPECVCDHAIVLSETATPIQRPLTVNSIYKQLNLQQYHYRDQFRGLQQIDTKATQALVKWNDNWITFIDHMISINLLRKNCRDLALPTSVDRLVIDAKKHLGTSEMVYSGPHCNIIKSSGVEVRGLGVTPVPKRAPLNSPILDDYKFVPYTGTMSEQDSVRACLRVVADNVRESTVQVVELVKDKNNVLSPTISNLFSEYVTLHEIVVFSSLKLDMPNIVVKHKEIDGIKRKTSLVVVTDVSEEVLNQIPDRLQEGAFILVRQPPNYPIDLIKQVDIILTHVNETGVVFLLRKSVAYVKPQVVSVTDDLNWISVLQASLSDNKPIVLLSEGNDGVLGLINCLKLEYTKSSILCMFLMDGKSKLDLDDNFFRKQLKKSLLMNVLRNGEWGTYVYFRKTVKNVDVCDHVVGTTEQGNMRSFYWCQGPPIRDGLMRPEQSLTCVYYTGLNFKDVMIASGKLRLRSVDESCDSNSYNLGIEFSGRNQSGERVMGILKEAALGSLIASDNDLSWKIPDKWSLEEGATVPATYCTVLFALIIVGKLKDRQSILIHSAAGGVGQAALNIATYYNCTIFTTVGSMRKRNIIKRLYPSLQDSHIGNSRDQSFEQMIMKQTKGKGVDIVVNSLSEQNLYAGLRCLSRGGKFFEIGRYDIMKDSNLDVRCILDNRSIFGINLDGAHDAVTWRKRQLQSALYDGIRLGYVKPLPRDVYKSDEVEAALSYMATGKHTGKIVVKIRDPQMNKFEPLTLSTKPKFYCISDKVYVLVGGLGGFGLELTEWLVKRGARKLVLVSRSGVSTDYQNFKIESWKEDGAKIVVSQQNLQTVEGCHKLIEDAHTLGSIDGIFNLAAVLDDGLFQNQNKERFASVLFPKLLITRNLDVTSRTHCPHLRRFVVFSSMVSGKGNIGQSSYAMGNSAMERICEIRKNEGYPALAIQWGMIGDVGMFEDYNNNLNTLETLRGAIKQKIASCLQVLDVFLNSDETIVSSTVMVNTSNNNKSEKVDLLEEIAKFMGLNLKHISLHSPLSQMGLDSITSVEIKQFLEQKFEIFKSVREVRNTTLHQLKEEQAAKIV
ncbi:hypothetical protein RI129_011115 [Pyrocoelia pectoralis]|uniref:Uncharacterized protein n=1 Tax=Pyrocoelia pectoralis TaxID=417401 RepID=A0AAN7VAK9_9COLE